MSNPPEPDGTGTYHPARIIDGRIEPGYFDSDVKQPE